MNYPVHSRVYPIRGTAVRADQLRSVQLLSLDAERAVFHVVSSGPAGETAHLCTIAKERDSPTLTTALASLAKRVGSAEDCGHDWVSRPTTAVTAVKGPGRFVAVDIADATLHEAREPFLSLDVIFLLECGRCCLLTTFCLPHGVLLSSGETSLSVSAAVTGARAPLLLAVRASRRAATPPRLARQGALLSTYVYNSPRREKRSRSPPGRETLLMAFTSQATTLCFAEFTRPSAGKDADAAWLLRWFGELPFQTHADGSFRSLGVTQRISELRWCHEDAGDYSDDPHPFLAALHTTSPLPGDAPVKELSLMMLEGLPGNASRDALPAPDGATAVDLCGGKCVFTEGPWSVRALDLALDTCFSITTCVSSHPLQLLGLLIKVEGAAADGNTCLALYSEQGEVARSPILCGRVIDAVVVQSLSPALVVLLSSSRREASNTHTLAYLSIQSSGQFPAIVHRVAISSESTLAEVSLPLCASATCTPVHVEHLLAAYRPTDDNDLQVVAAAPLVSDGTVCIASTPSPSGSLYGCLCALTTSFTGQAAVTARPVGVVHPFSAEDFLSPGNGSVVALADAGGCGASVALLRDARLVTWQAPSSHACLLGYLHSSSPTIPSFLGRLLEEGGEQLSTQAALVPLPASPSAAQLALGVGFADATSLLIVASWHEGKLFVLVAVIGGSRSGEILHETALADTAASGCVFWGFCPVAALPVTSQCEGVTAFYAFLVARAGPQSCASPATWSRRQTLLRMTITPYVPSMLLDSDTSDEAANADVTEGKGKPVPLPTPLVTCDYVESRDCPIETPREHTADDAGLQLSTDALATSVPSVAVVTIKMDSGKRSAAVNVHISRDDNGRNGACVSFGGAGA